MPHGRVVARSPSMADVAARAGVSHQTVSRVINGSTLVKAETRERVESAIDELGYRRNAAARALVTNRSGRIGMVSAHLGLYGPSTMAEAVQEAAYAEGYDLSLVGLPAFSLRALEQAVGRLLDQAVEALIVAVAHAETADAVRRLDLAVPVVLAGGVRGGAPMAVGVDQVLGAELATGLLLRAGHRQVAHVTGPDDWVEAAQREEGWRRAHARAGRTAGRLEVGDWSARSGYEAGLRLAADAEVTAVFAANDAVATGLLRAAHEVRRRVPDDLEIIGFDDTPESAYSWPPLTTVRQDLREAGRRAVDLVVGALMDEPAAPIELVAPRLIIRATTRPATRTLATDA